jgi:hypothetical protein
MNRKLIMKKKIISAVGASLLLAFGVLVAFAQPKGDTVKVKGGTQVIYVSAVK